MASVDAEPSPVPTPPVNDPSLDPLAPEVLGVYKRMLGYLFIGTLVLVVIVTAAVLYEYYRNVDPPLLLLVMLAGMLGALFSALSRLYSFEDLPKALVSKTMAKLGGSYLLMYSFVPPLVGVIAAVVLYLIFIGKLVEGGIFPTFECKPDPDSCNTLIGLMQHYGPKAPMDFGRVLVWAFIAGFAERLVPDTLQTFVKERTKKE